MSSGAIPASLDIGPAGPVRVAKVLEVEALPWFSYVRSQPVTSVSPYKSGGGGVASLRGPPSSCVRRYGRLFLLHPFCDSGGLLYLLVL